MALLTTMITIRIVRNLPAVIFLFIGVTFSFIMSAEMCLALFCHVNIGTFNSSCQMVLDARETSQETTCMLSVFELLSSAANWVKIISYSRSILYIMLVNGIDV